MRIAVWHNLHSGGGMRALYCHVKGLAMRGHSIEVWSPPTANRTFLPLRDFAKEHIVPLKWKERSEKSIWEKLWSGFFGIHQRLKAMDAHCQVCAREINASGFDVLFANSCVFFRTPFIGRYAQIPRLLYLQEPFRWLYEALPRQLWAIPEISNDFWRRPDELVLYARNLARLPGLRRQAADEMANARAFDRVLVNSYFSRESVMRAYGISSTVCYLGVDTNIFRNLGLPREDFVIGIGSFTPEKNIEFIIESLSLIPGSRPKLVWVGNAVVGDYLETTKALANKRNVVVEPRVNITDEELVLLLNRALCMVYAPRLEPFGLGPLEANACNTPVVGIIEGGLRETIIDGRNGLLVEYDRRAFAKAVQKLQEDRQYAAKLGATGARVVAENWSLKAATDRIEHQLVALVDAESTTENIHS